ncbi:MAG: hypothetical protein FWD61_05765 [Phycisphaerales bacterium]|nr:hypothetical protein [Phycisphaerales bacterium]
MTMTVGGVEDVRVLDHMERLHRVERRTSEETMILFLTDAYDARKMEIDASGIPMVMVRCGREFAFGGDHSISEVAAKWGELKLPRDIAVYRDTPASRWVLRRNDATSFRAFFTRP